MKRKFFKLALSVLFGLFMITSSVSCKKNETNPSELNSNLIGKWNVSNDNAKYGSFEFTKDKKYIIEQRVSSLQSAPENSILKSSSSEPNTVYIIIFGDYSTLSENGGVYNLNLGDFGLIKITISESGASIEVNGEVFDITKDEDIVTGNQDKTELLCHTWRFNLPEGYFDDDFGTITFTPNGTFLIINDDGDDVTFGKWKWASTNSIEVETKSYLESPPVGEGEEGQIIEEIDIVNLEIVKLTTTELILSNTDEEGETETQSFKR
ncbi:MAG: hypothetical protein LBS01_08380 [Prevotellaceae bacterium]|jgi:hypothetical protein|nr:hypothetical protein [Prevotellaceae bacterium]